jgi:hypothetical protein
MYNKDKFVFDVYRHKKMSKSLSVEMEFRGIDSCSTMLAATSALTA